MQHVIISFCSKPRPLATVHRSFLLLRCSTTDDDAHRRRLPGGKVPWWSPDSTSSWRWWCCLARHPSFCLRSYVRPKLYDL